MSSNGNCQLQLLGNYNMYYLSRPIARQPMSRRNVTPSQLILSTAEEHSCWANPTCTTCRAQ